MIMAVISCTVQYLVVYVRQIAVFDVLSVC